MSVTIPPRMVAKDSGIRVRAGERLALLAACMSTGINNASAATLFMKLERMAPATPIKLMWAINERDASTT